MNYWLLTTEYPPFFGGGIGTYSVITASMLADKGHRVSVFVPDASVKDVAITDEKGIRVIRFGTSRTNSSAFLGHVTNISYEFAHIIKQFIEKESPPDCIEAQEYLGIAYYLLQYKHLLYDWCKDIPVIVTMHSPSFLYMEYNQVPMYRYPNYWICEMERFCLQAADHVISPSQFMVRELEKRFTLSHQRLTIIPNPFTGSINNITPLTGTPHSGEIVFYGKLTAQKGAFELMRYFEHLWDNGFQRPLYLLGGQDIVYYPDGRTMGDIIRDRYKRFIDQGLLKMENRVKPAEIRDRLARAELVIIPSNNDNLPYVAFEMMALGKTVLVSLQGGQSEVVEDGISGFIFDHNNPDTFYKQLERALALSPADQQSINENAIRKVEEGYSPDVIYAQKIKLLEDLISSAGTHRVFPFIRPIENISNVNRTTGEPGKLSVVIPYYNLGAYIDETIRSIRNVDYKNIEIIIVNDGSTDRNSLAKLDAYRNANDIRVLDKENGGLGNARNYGAEKAGGEYLAFLDADDTIAVDYYSKAIKVFQQYSNVHFAGCWVKYFDKSTNMWPAFQPEPPVLLYHNMVNSSSLIYKRQSFLDAGQNDSRMKFQGLEDYDSVISMVKNGCGGVVLPEQLFNYRVRPDSMIRAISRPKKLFLFQHITASHKQFYATFAADTFNLQNANGPGIFMDNPSLDYHLVDQLPFGGKLAKKIIALIKRNELAKTTAYKIYKLLKK